MFQHFDIPRAQFYYCPDFLDEASANYYLDAFSQLEFEQGYVRGGKENRLSRFYGNAAMCETGTTYYYSGKLNPPTQFTPELDLLCEELTLTIAEQIKHRPNMFVFDGKTTAPKFNSCLVNYYADGTKGIGWHSDSEKSLVLGSIIASVSLGATRKFRVAHREDTTDVAVRATPPIELELTHGSLVLMGGEMQQFYKHTVPVQKKITNPRINLTYRWYQ